MHLTNQNLLLLWKMQKNDYHPLMTEKDYFRIKELELENLDYLEVILKINEKEKLVNKILENIQ